MVSRDQTRRLMVGDVPLGAGAPVVVQSMTNTPTCDVDATVRQIQALQQAGCELVRATVSSPEDAQAFARIRPRITIPLAADVHFSAQLAVAAVENGADKLRINPGNIGDAGAVRRVVDACKAHRTPIRIGVNAGSLHVRTREELGVSAKALAASAMEHVRLLEGMHFYDIVLSLKASDAPMCVAAYQAAASLCEYPLHIGITEAGAGQQGLIKSAVGIGALLLQGLGDTLRVSLSGDPVAEISAAYDVLRAAGVRKRGVEIIACPTCGRSQIDVEALAQQVMQRCAHITQPIKVAVMGCAVNGPGEARQADVGLAGAQGSAVLFCGGKVLRTVSAGEQLDALMQQIDRLTQPSRGDTQ